MAPRIVDLELKRKQILEAALEVSAGKGFYTATIADVAEQAGIGKGTVYEYFDSKELLFIALVDRIDRQIEESVRNQITDLADPREKLMQLIFTVCNLFERMPELGAIWSERLILHKNPLFSKERLESNPGLIDIFGEVIDRGVDSGHFQKRGPEAILVLAMLEGLLLQKARNPEAVDISALAETACALVLEGLAK